MTPKEFAHACDVLGLSNSDVALMTGNTIRAVQFWRNGRSPIPQSVALILDAMECGRLDMDWVIDWVSTNQTHVKEMH